jgi:hypothetical protein
MTPQDARRLLILLSLLTTTVFAILLILSPLLIQIDSTDAYRILQIVFPVFAGYLGTGVLFLFRDKPARNSVADAAILRYFVYGPFLIFWSISAAVFTYLYLSNLTSSTGAGMKVSDLSNYITMLMAFMNATVGALISFLFDSEALQKQLGLTGASSSPGSSKP